MFAELIQANANTVPVNWTIPGRVTATMEMNRRRATPGGVARRRYCRKRVVAEVIFVTTVRLSSGSRAGAEVLAVHSLDGRGPEEREPKGTFGRC